MHIILYDITFKNNFSQVGCSKHLEDTLKHQIKKHKRFCEAPNVSKTSAPVYENWTHDLGVASSTSVGAAFSVILKIF